MAKLKNTLFFTFLYILCSSNSFAVQAPHKEVVENDKTVATLKKDYKFSKHKLKKLSGEISQIESELGRKNKKYLALVKKKSHVEEMISTLSKQIEEQKRKLDVEIVKVKKILSVNLVNRLESDQSSEDIFASKVLIKALRKRVQDLNFEKNKNAQLEVELSQLLTRYNEYKEFEYSLSSLMVELEEEKKSLATKYISTKEESGNLQEKIQLLKVNKFALIRNKLREELGTFDSPIETFSNMEYKKKGVTFHFSKDQDLKTTKKGRIFYIGTLSSYGNVMMIDHGEELKSIILGQFKPTVKKGQIVDTNEIIGKTHLVGQKVGKIYFEVRKNNQAKNTIHLLNKVAKK